jgi:hypothetical protein
VSHVHGEAKVSDILDSYDKQQRVKESWAELVHHLRVKNQEIINKGTDIIPEVAFAELEGGLSKSKDAEIKDCGVVIVRGVVEEQQVCIPWK